MRRSSQSIIFFMRCLTMSYPKVPGASTANSDILIQSINISSTFVWTHTGCNRWHPLSTHLPTSSLPSSHLRSRKPPHTFPHVPGSSQKNNSSDGIRHNTMFRFLKTTRRTSCDEKTVRLRGGQSGCRRLYKRVTLLVSRRRQ